MIRGEANKVSVPLYDPWSGTAADDHAIANVGQLKRKKGSGGNS